MRRAASLFFVAPLALGLLFTTSPLAAQSESSTVNVGVAAHVSTMGVGGDLALSFGKFLGARGRVSFQPYDPTATWDNQVDLTVGLDSPTFAALVDVFPTGGGIRVTGGLVRFNEGFQLTADLTQPVDFNGTVYDPSEIGQLSGLVSGRRTAPYLGLGWGNAARSGIIGFTLDVGIAFYGSPQVALDATGPFSDDPTFRTNLEAERLDLEAELADYQYYPVLSLGMTVGISNSF